MPNASNNRSSELWSRWAARLGLSPPKKRKQQQNELSSDPRPRKQRYSGKTTRRLTEVLELAPTLDTDGLCKLTPHQMAIAGLCHETGRGVERRSFLSAAGWYRAAAERGHAQGQHLLACMCESRNVHLNHMVLCDRSH